MPDKESRTAPCSRCGYTKPIVGRYIGVNTKRAHHLCAPCFENEKKIGIKVISEGINNESQQT